MALNPFDPKTWPSRIAQQIEHANTAETLTLLAKEEAARAKAWMAIDSLDATEAERIGTALDTQQTVLTELPLPADAAAEAHYLEQAKPPLVALLDGIERSHRADTVATLDQAAKVLTTVFTAINGALVAAGFATGDFSRFYRNDFRFAVAYLLLAGVALLTGTFAFLIDAVEANWKLRLEQAAIYLGVVAFAAAFAIASWGLAQGSNSGQDRPTLTASITTTAATSQQPSTITFTAQSSRSSIRRSDALFTDLWGEKGGTYTRIRGDTVGPNSDGIASDSPVAVVPASLYDHLLVTAYVGHLSVLTAPAASSNGASSPLNPPADCTTGNMSSAIVACALLAP